jgi:hypothetical protein
MRKDVTGARYLPSQDDISHDGAWIIAAYWPLAFGGIKTRSDLLNYDLFVGKELKEIGHRTVRLEERILQQGCLPIAERRTRSPSDVPLFFSH